VQTKNGPQTLSTFCVPEKTPMTWETSDDVFFVRFAPGYNGSQSPFKSGDTSASGTASSTASETAQDKVDCFAFAVADCAVPANATGTKCGTADPKVVVGGNGMRPQHHHEEKSEQ
jgi:hypothetical protein